MKPFGRFLAGLAFVILTVVPAAAYQNPVFGKWNPPAVLVPFWEGINPAWWNEPGRKDLVEYCQKFAETHKVQPFLDAIIQDQRENPEETRTFVYSWVVTKWQSPEVMRRLNRLLKSKDARDVSIANDFIAEIESAKKDTQ